MPLIPVAGGFIPAGNIQNEPAGDIGANKLINQSGITSKVTSYPAGWYEVEGYREIMNNDQQIVYRYFEGPWVSRKAFYDFMLGYSYTDTSGTISRQIPKNHEEYTWLYAVDCELIEGKGAITATLDNATPPNQTGVIEYVNTDPTVPTSGVTGIAKVKITYRWLDYEIRSDEELRDTFNNDELYRNVTRHSDWAIKALPIPGATKLRFAEAPLLNKPIEAGLAQFIFPTREITYTWHDVPDVPQVNIDLCSGSVNDAAFDVPIQVGGFPVSGYGSETDGYPAQTLLFITPKVIRKRSVLGRVSFDIAYKFLYQPQGWNKFPAIVEDPVTHKTSLKFVLATFDGTATGQTVYTPFAFDLLFKAPNQKGRYQNGNW